MQPGWCQPVRQEFMENECEALPGVAHPGIRDNRSTLNTKTGYDDDMMMLDARAVCECCGAHLRGVERRGYVDDVEVEQVGLLDVVVNVSHVQRLQQLVNRQDRSAHRVGQSVLALHSAKQSTHAAASICRKIWRGVGVSQVKPSNSFRRLEKKLVLTSVFDTSFTSLMM